MSGVEAPILSAAKLHTDDACPKDCNYGFRSKFSVLPDSRSQPGKCGGRSSDPSVDLSVEGVGV